MPRRGSRIGRKDYCIIEEIHREVIRLFGNGDISIKPEVPFNDFIEIANNIKSKIEIVDNIEPKIKIVDNIEPKRKIVVKRKND